MLNGIQHLLFPSVNGNCNGSMLSRKAKAIKNWLLSASAMLLLTCFAQAQNYCPGPNNPQYGQWLDQQAFSGQYRVCTPNQRDRGWNVGVNGGYAPYGGGSFDYHNSTNRRSWDCGRNNLPSNGQPYYIDDRRSGMRTAPRKYRGW